MAHIEGSIEFMVSHFLFSLLNTQLKDNVSSMTFFCSLILLLVKESIVN